MSGKASLSTCIRELFINENAIKIHVNMYKSDLLYINISVLSLKFTITSREFKFNYSVMKTHVSIYDEQRHKVYLLDYDTNHFELF